MVVQAVFLFGAETWVLLAAMPKKLGGVPVGLLQQVTRMKARRQWYGSWRKAVSYIILQWRGTQPLQTYIDRRQETVEEWVDLQPIFELRAKETSYEGGGRHQETWCWKAAAEKYMRAMLEEILEAARE